MLVRHFLLFFMLYACIAHADIFSEENPSSNLPKPFSVSDYSGVYYAVPQNKGDKPPFELKINPDLSAVLIGNRIDGSRQTYSLAKGVIVDQLLIYKKVSINNIDNIDQIQMVLNGYQYESNKRLDGTIYVYQNNVPNRRNSSQSYIFMNKLQ